MCIQWIHNESINHDLLLVRVEKMHIVAPLPARHTAYCAFKMVETVVWNILAIKPRIASVYA